ncbi:TPA: hypothetical protein DF272_06435 [Candidatus Falkowbacteria bacterium]|nr:hypothetical protein [Candidatus Falkowbacteria bacterium]
MKPLPRDFIIAAEDFSALLENHRSELEGERPLVIFTWTDIQKRLQSLVANFPDLTPNHFLYDLMDRLVEFGIVGMNRHIESHWPKTKPVNVTIDTNLIISWFCKLTACYREFLEPHLKAGLHFNFERHTDTLKAVVDRLQVDFLLEQWVINCLGYDKNHPRFAEKIAANKTW